MLKASFSTVACPTWTLDRVARSAAEWGYDGVELRSFGEGSTKFACDPALTSGAKVAKLFRRCGVEPMGIGSGCRFDEAVFPPVLGEVLLSRHRSVEAAQHAVDVAQACGAGFVRVFGFQVPGGFPPQTRRGTVNRIVSRLRDVCDHARHRDCLVVLENGGDFSSAEDLCEIIDRVGSPLMRGCYDLHAAMSLGEDPIEGLATLGARAVCARLRDRRGEEPVALGDGEYPVAAFVRAASRGDLGRMGGWAIFEWEAAWLHGLAPAESVLPEAARRIAAWSNPNEARTGAA